MPIYSNIYGTMMEEKWDAHVMEVITIQEFAAHRKTAGDLFGAQNCLRCITAVALEEALTKFIEEEKCSKSE